MFGRAGPGPATIRLPFAGEETREGDEHYRHFSDDAALGSRPRTYRPIDRLRTLMLWDREWSESVRRIRVADRP